MIDRHTAIAWFVGSIATVVVMVAHPRQVDTDAVGTTKLLAGAVWPRAVLHLAFIFAVHAVADTVADHAFLDACISPRSTIRLAVEHRLRT